MCFFFEDKTITGCLWASVAVSLAYCVLMEEETVWLNVSWMLVSFNCSWFGPSHVDGGGDGTTAVFTNGMRSAGPCLSILSWWLGANGTSDVNAIASDIIEAICCVCQANSTLHSLLCSLFQLAASRLHKDLTSNLSSQKKS
jgi:hypothetical protein